MGKPAALEWKSKIYSLNKTPNYIISLVAYKSRYYIPPSFQQGDTIWGAVGMYTVLMTYKGMKRNYIQQGCNLVAGNPLLLLLLILAAEKRLNKKNP